MRILVVVWFVLLALSQPPASAADSTAPEASGSREKTFRAWLDAVNSGQQENLRNFILAQFEPSPTEELPVDRIARHQYGLYQASSGLTLLKLSTEGDDKVVGVL